MTMPAPIPITDEEIVQLEELRVGSSQAKLASAEWAYWRLIARIRADANKIDCLAQSLSWACEERDKERASIRADAETIQRLRAERNTEMLGAVEWQEKLKVAEAALDRIAHHSTSVPRYWIAEEALAKVRRTHDADG